MADEIAKIIDPMPFKHWEALRVYCISRGDDEATATRYADETHGASIEAVRETANAVRAFLLSDEAIAAGRDAILEGLRDRRLLKWLFPADPDNHGAIGYVDGPIDADTQNECASSLARAALTAVVGEG